MGSWGVLEGSFRPLPGRIRFALDRIVGDHRRASLAVSVIEAADRRSAGPPLGRWRAPSASRRLLRRALLGAALAACGGPEEAEEEASRRGAAAPLRFVEVTEEAGLEGFRHETGAVGRKWFPETMGAGAAWTDYDGDGRLDLMLVGGGRWPADGGDRVGALRLYRNLGGGGFEEATEAAGLAGIEAYGFGVWPADVDGDGDEDVFVTTLGRDLLLLNDGGVFRETAREAGLGGEARWTTAAAFFDADGDGRLDLFVGGYVDWSPQRDVFCSLDGRRKSYCTPELYRGIGGRFYRGGGDGTFVDESEARGFGGDRGKTLGAVTLDFDGDGWTDLFVANDTLADRLYHNQGGRFTEVGVTAGVAFDETGRPRGGMGVDAGVLETGVPGIAAGGGGAPGPGAAASLVVGNFSKEMIGVYRWAGDGTFADRSASSRIGRSSLLRLTFGLCLADFDLDGDLDLFAANGHVQDDVGGGGGILYRQPPQLFLNDGSGLFAEPRLAPGDALRTPLVARGAACGDFDGDGDVDLLVTENGGPARLLRNRAAQGGGASLRVRLRGPGANRDAVGYRVTAEAGGRWMEREVRGGGSYLSGSERTMTFGLGAAPGVDRLLVYGPGGLVAERRDLPAGGPVVVDLAEVSP